jgi:hypothetical protein
MRIDGVVTICRGSRCIYDPTPPAYPVLRYGQVDESGGYRCRSAVTGITCTVAIGRARGKGFLINRDGVKRVGP